MLTESENMTFTQVGPGTPMGELLRRYWQPIAAAAELDDNPTKPVRLMGEDLVLYKSRAGKYGLIDLHCPHRRADLSYGIVEDQGLRCNYHGWLFNESGSCLHQPFEEVAHPEANFKDRVQAKAYPVEEKAGLLWAYLGPLPAPLVPDWDRFHDVGFKEIGFSVVPCNWLQCQENSIDPVHLEWLHLNWPNTLREPNAAYTAPHLEIAFDEFEYGFTYRRRWEGSAEDDEFWTVGRVCLWPNGFYYGFFEWRVPIDDDNTLSVAWFTRPLPGDEPFEQERIPYWWAPLKDEQTGRWITSHIINQDYVAWVGQGMLADRSKEHLGDSDRGVILLRRRLDEQMKLVMDGGEPKGLIRDAAVNHAIHLPRVINGHMPNGRSGSAPGPARNAHLASRPDAITEEYARLWRERNERAAT